MPSLIHYWNLNGQCDVEQMPLCPLCDQPMFRGEDIKLVEVERCMGLAHASCCIEADQDDED